MARELIPGRRATRQASGSGQPMTASGSRRKSTHLEREGHAPSENAQTPATTRATDVERLVAELKRLDSPRLRDSESGAIVPEGSAAEWLTKIEACTGSTNPYLHDILIRAVALAMGCAEDEGTKAKPFVMRLNDGLALMHAIGPRTPLEGLLAAQMTVAHSMSIRAADYACWSHDTEVKRGWANLATKFMRTFTQQVEALERLRGRAGTTQTVRVEHVTVEAGGQAVVGAVTAGGGGHGEN